MGWHGAPCHNAKATIMIVWKSARVLSSDIVMLAGFRGIGMRARSEHARILTQKWGVQSWR